MPDAIEWRPSSVAFFARGALHPFVTPLDLLRFRPLSPLARVRMGAAVLALQRFAGDRAPYERITARAWIERRMGRQAWAEVWGPLLRGKFGERADEIAMVWLWSKLRLRRSVRGEDVRQERLGYPRDSWEALFARARALGRPTAGGRVLTDRPAARSRARAAASGSSPGAPGSFRAGHDPRAFAPRRRRGLRPRPRHGSERRLRRGCSTPRSPPRWGRRTSRARAAIEYFAALCLLLELDRGFSPYYWTNVADRALPFVGLIEHTNFVDAGALRRPPLPLRRELPAARPRAARAATRDALLDRYEAGLRAVNPAFSRDVGPARVALRRAGGAADRHRRLRGPDPAAAHARRRARARQHDAGLSRGPRDELRRAARAARRRRPR